MTDKEPNFILDAAKLFESGIAYGREFLHPVYRSVYEQASAAVAFEFSQGVMQAASGHLLQLGGLEMALEYMDILKEAMVKAAEMNLPKNNTVH